MPELRKKEAEAKIAAYKAETDTIISQAKLEVAKTLLCVFAVSAVLTAVLIKIYNG